MSLTLMRRFPHQSIFDSPDGHLQTRHEALKHPLVRRDVVGKGTGATMIAGVFIMGDGNPRLVECAVSTWPVSWTVGRVDGICT